MAAMMWRAAKGEGVGNVFLEQVPVPDPGPEEVLARTRVSLISRGSELWHRYVLEGPVRPDAMGYSTTGTVEAAGDGVTGFAAGDRVVASAPHAEYSLCSVAADAPRSRLHPLHPELSFEQGTFHPLAASGAGWAQALQITADDRVAVLGQGLVGNLVMQFAGWAGASGRPSSPGASGRPSSSPWTRWSCAAGSRGRWARPRS